MNKNVRNLLLLLFLIVVPFLVYAFLQVKALREDQKRADTIYEKQMETVLFSLNQYADDMMDQWVRRLSGNNKSISKNAFDLVLGNESIQMLNLRRMSDQKDSVFLNDYVQLDSNAHQLINAWYQSKDSLMVQLSNYLAAGFQKIQSTDKLESIGSLRPSQAGITVMLYDQDSVLYNALFVFEASYWAEQLVGGKMHEVAQDEFRLAVLQKPKGQEEPMILYSTSPFDLMKNRLQKELWILPNIHLAIQSKGVSYSELIENRSRNNLYILFFSVLMLFVGAIIMIRNIRNALKIAQLKSDFVSNVSHEIRTPLSLIKMYAETLMLGRLPTEEKKQQYYEVIHHESGRLTYLVNNILNFSRIEANKKTYALVKHDMNELVQQICSNYTYTFKEQNVVCDLELASSPMPIQVDGQAFDEALSNLIENAIKFSHKEKKIRITTFIEKDYACCQVSDLSLIHI